MSQFITEIILFIFCFFVFKQIGKVSLGESEDISVEKEIAVAVLHDGNISVSASACLPQEINATNDNDLEEHTSQVLDEAGEPSSVTTQRVNQIHATKDNTQDLEECSVGQHLKQAMQQHKGDNGCHPVDVDICEHEEKLCHNGQESGDAKMSLHRQNCPAKKESLAAISNCDDSTSSFVECEILVNGNSDEATSDKFISENISHDNVTNDETILNYISTDGAAAGDALDKSDAEEDKEEEEEKQCQDFTPTAIPLTSECTEPSTPLKSDATKTKLAAELTNKFMYDFDMD